MLELVVLLSVLSKSFPFLYLLLLFEPLICTLFILDMHKNSFTISVSKIALTEQTMKKI